MAYVYTMGSTSQPRIDITGIQNTIAARAATITAMLQNPSLAGGQRAKLQEELKVLQAKLGELGAQGAQVDAMEVQNELPTMIRMAAKQLQASSTPTPASESAPIPAAAPVAAAQPVGGATTGYLPATATEGDGYDDYDDASQTPYDTLQTDYEPGFVELWSVMLKKPVVWGPLVAVAGAGALYLIMRR